MKWRKFLAILLVLSILCSLPITTALAADEDTEETEYELYPLPQEITYGTDNSNLPSTVNAYFGAGIDTYTVDRAEQALSHGGLTMSRVDAAENAQLIVEIYSETGNNAIFGDVNASLFAKIDAYLWSLQEVRSVFWARTLMQLSMASPPCSRSSTRPPAGWCAT